MDSYAYAGHSVLLGKGGNTWQELETVLSRFGGKKGIARRRYREYVKEGVGQGRRAELVKGGLRRGMGGWSGARDGKGEPERITAVQDNPR